MVFIIVTWYIHQLLAVLKITQASYHHKQKRKASIERKTIVILVTLGNFQKLRFGIFTKAGYLGILLKEVVMENIKSKRSLLHITNIVY